MQALNKGIVTHRRAMLIVFLVVVVDLLGFGIVLPLLPVTGDDYVRALIFEGANAPRWSGVIVGLLMASFSAMQFVFAPIWGRLSDRIGRRPVLLVGLVGSVAFYTLFGIAASFPAESSATVALSLLFVARIGAGIAGATISTAQAVIADSTPPERRKQGMAIIGAAFGIAFTFGPLLGALALALAPGKREATSSTGYLAAGLSFLALILAFVLLPETRIRSVQTTERRGWINLSAWRTALTNGSVAPVILIFFLATLGFGGFETTLAMLLRDALQLNPNRSYLVFAYVGFILMLAQGVLYRRLAGHLGEAAFISMGILLMSLGVLSLAVLTLLADAEDVSLGLRLAILLLGLATAVVGFAFLTPSAQALISRRTPADRQGEILGVTQSSSALARILGPIFGLTLYKLTQPPLLPYVFGAGLLLAMLPLLPRIRRG
jgi:DHA1 family tetracycline resistance protein-like MFS transporter